MCVCVCVCVCVDLEDDISTVCGSEGFPQKRAQVDRDKSKLEE